MCNYKQKLFKCGRLLQLNILSAGTTCPFKCILTWQTRNLARQSYQKKFHSKLFNAKKYNISWTYQLLHTPTKSWYWQLCHFPASIFPRWLPYSPFLRGRAGTAAATGASFRTLYKPNSLQAKLFSSQTLYKPSRTEVSCYLTSFTHHQPATLVIVIIRDLM